MYRRFRFKPRADPWRYIRLAGNDLTRVTAGGVTEATHLLPRHRIKTCQSKHNNMMCVILLYYMHRATCFDSTESSSWCNTVVLRNHIVVFWVTRFILCIVNTSGWKTSTLKLLSRGEKDGSTWCCPLVISAGFCKNFRFFRLSCQTSLKLASPIPNTSIERMEWLRTVKTWVTTRIME